MSRLTTLQCPQPLWNVKEPKHLSLRVGRGVPGVVVWPKKGWYTSHRSWSPVLISPCTSAQKLRKTNQESEFYMTTAVITAVNERGSACSLNCNNKPHFKETKREFKTAWLICTVKTYKFKILTHSLYSTLFALRWKPDKESRRSRKETPTALDADVSGDLFHSPSLLFAPTGNIVLVEMNSCSKDDAVCL